MRIHEIRAMTEGWIRAGVGRCTRPANLSCPPTFGWEVVLHPGSVMTMLLMAALILLPTAPAIGQSVSRVHLVVVSSDGTDADPFPGGEEAGSDLSGEIARWFAGALKSATVLKASELSVEGVLLGLGSAAAAYDSGDVLLMFWLGPWRPGGENPFGASWVARGAATVTAEYLVNVVSLAAPRCVAAVVVAPPARPFPAGALAQYPAARGGGGKHIFIASGGASADYDDLLSAVVAAAESPGDPAVVDRNKNGNVTYSEWLSAFYRVARAKKAPLRGYTMERSTDPTIQRVPK